MAGQAPVGQKLTSNPNVLAKVTVAGDVWGANGGGAIAIGGGATDQTGYVKPVAITPSSCETATNYIPSSLPVTARTVVRTVLGQQNVDLLSGQVLDNTLASGGSNAG